MTRHKRLSIDEIIQESGAPGMSLASYIDGSRYSIIATNASHHPPSICEWEEIRKLVLEGGAKPRPSIDSYPIDSYPTNPNSNICQKLQKIICTGLSRMISTDTLTTTFLYDSFLDSFVSDPTLIIAAVADLYASALKIQHDPWHEICVFDYNAFLGLQAHRIAHSWWFQPGRKTLAQQIQLRVSEVTMLNFHPTARIGRGIAFNRARKMEIGENVELGDNCKLGNCVTIFGRSSDGDGAKIGNQTVIGMFAKVLSNVTVGDDVDIVSFSVIKNDVPSGWTAWDDHPPPPLSTAEMVKLQKKIKRDEDAHRSFIYCLYRLTLCVEFLNPFRRN